MNKYIATLVLFLLCTGISYAQDNDPWVGTWTSQTYRDVDWDASENKEDLVYANYRLIIRISKTDNQYLVRSKIIKVGNPDDVSYSLPYVVIRVDNNEMWLESYLEKDPFYVNGEIDSYEDITYKFKLSLHNDRLHYSFYEFDRKRFNNKMQFLGSDTVKFPHHASGNELNLFSDEW